MKCLSVVILSTLLLVSGQKAPWWFVREGGVNGPKLVIYRVNQDQSVPIPVQNVEYNVPPEYQRRFNDDVAVLPESLLFQGQFDANSSSLSVDQVLFLIDGWFVPGIYEISKNGKSGLRLNEPERERINLDVADFTYLSKPDAAKETLNQGSSLIAGGSSLFNAFANSFTAYSLYTSDVNIRVARAPYKWYGVTLVDRDARKFVLQELNGLTSLTVFKGSFRPFGTIPPWTWDYAVNPRKLVNNYALFKGILTDDNLFEVHDVFFQSPGTHADKFYYVYKNGLNGTASPGITIKEVNSEHFALTVRDIDLTAVSSEPARNIIIDGLSTVGAVIVSGEVSSENKLAIKTLYDPSTNFAPFSARD